MSICINREELDANAEQYFCHMCGLHKRKSTSLAIRSSAYAVRDKMLGSINPQAVTRAFDNKVIVEDGLHIEGCVFPCRTLRLLDKERVQAVYAFVLTTGGLCAVQQPLLTTIYRDLWATAYINAAGAVLRGLLSRNHEQPIYISEAIAPGYYDMSAEKIVDLMQIIDSTEINVSLQGMMMKPLKSCAGFYLAVESKEQVSFLDERCLYCHKESDGCAFCVHRNNGV